MDITIKSLPVIEADFEAAENYLTEQLEGYKTVVFTEDTKKEAKETVANLRKDKKALQDKVKSLKSEYMAPFEAFADKANLLIEKYDVPINYINNQIADFEAKRVEEKKALISEIYLELIPEEDIQEALTLDSIYNKKWENATFAQKNIREEIMQHKADFKSAMTTITAMHSDKEEEAKKMYIRNRNLNEVLEYLAQYEEYKKQIAEQERLKAQQELEAKIRQEEREKAEAELRHQQEMAELERQKEEEIRQTAEEANAAIEEAEANVIERFIPEESEEPVEDYSYTIKLTSESKKKLEMFMNSIGIEYEEIDF
jgi:hypothetical protein